MNQLDTGKGDAGSSFRFETEHGPYPAFDAAMILLNGVIHIFAERIAMG